jgi:hypothetical protein
MKKTKIIYNHLLGYTRQGAKLQKVEKEVKLITFMNKDVDLIDYTEATAWSPYAKIVLNGVVYFELIDKLPKVPLNI